MSKYKQTEKEMLQDLLDGQLREIRRRLVETICEVDNYIDDLEKRFKTFKIEWKKKTR